MANTQTTQTNLPAWVTGAAQSGVADITSWLKSPSNYVYGSKTGESLYTPLSGSQKEAIGNTNWMADQDLRKLLGLDEAQGMYEQFGNAAAPQLTGDYSNAAGAALDPSKYGVRPGGDLSTERLVDENGFLGKISEYMNPYLEGVLNPQIKKLNEQLQLGRNDLGASEMMSGAFGDARHGIEEGKLYDDTEENVADVTGQAYSNAYNDAMTRRAADESRKYSSDQYNIEDANRALEREMGVDLSKAQFGDADAGRLLTRDTLNQASDNRGIDRKAEAAKGVTDVGQLFFKNFNDANDALFNAGKIERDASEEQRQAKEDFQTAIKDKRYNDAIKLLGAIQGSPQPTSSTTTNKSSDGMWGILASILGASI